MAAGLLKRLNALDAEQRRYTLETLVARLRDVEQLDRLCVLFSDDAWLHGRFEGNGGAYDGYRADLDIAWYATAGEARREIDAGGDAPALAHCWRISLIRTSLNSIAGNFPPALVARAIQTGYWSADKAFGVIPSIADIEQKLEICVAVLEGGRADPMMRMNAQKLAVDFTLELEREDARSKWLVRLAPLFDEAYLPSAKEAAEGIDDPEARAPALAAIAVRFGDREKEAVLDAAGTALESIAAPARRGRAIAQMARYLSGEHAMRAAQVAFQIAPSSDRVEALASLIDAFSGEDGEHLAQQVVKQLWALDNHNLAYSLSKVLRHLPELARADIASTALERAKDLDDMTQDYDSPRPVAIIGLAPYLDAAGLEKALAIARSMSSGGHLVTIKASVFAALASRMSAAEREPVVKQALESLGRESFGPYVVSNLVELIPLLPEAERAGVLKRALDAAVTLWDEKPNQGMLGEVSPRLKALTSLVPFLSGELLAEALGNARVIKDNKERADTFLALARLLAGEQRRKAMRLSYDAVWSIRDDQMGIFSIEEIFAGLDGEIAAVAFNGLDALSKKGYPNDWLKAFGALAPRLSAQDLQRASETIAQMKEAIDRATGYTLLAAYAAPSERERYQGLVIKSIRAMPDYSEHLIAYAIRDAAPYLNGANADAAWSIVVKLERFERSEAIMQMASRLEGGTALAALPEIRRLENAYHRSVGLWRVSSALPEPEKSEARAAAFDSAMEMPVDALDAEKAILELLPHHEGEQRKQAIRAGVARAEHFGNVEMGARTFAQLAPFMKGRQKTSALAEALKRAVRIEQPETRAEMLTSIFSQMDTKGLQRALTTVLTIEEPDERFEVLASLAPFLPDADPPAVRRHIVERLFSLRDENRVEVLRFLGHPAVFGTPTVHDPLRGRLVNDLEEICWRWGWR
jgi:hypothetical protein